MAQEECRDVKKMLKAMQNLKLEEFEVEVETGMVVLDAIHRIQATDAPDLGWVMRVIS